jgi:hypothetical protein
MTGAAKNRCVLIECGAPAPLFSQHIVSRAEAPERAEIKD